MPTAISSLIDGAVAAFDADRNTSRRYPIRASALLRARHLEHAAARVAQEARKPRPPLGLAMWQVNRVIDYIETHLAEITGENLADVVDLSIGQLFRSFRIRPFVPSVSAPYRRGPPRMAPGQRE